MATIKSQMALNDGMSVVLKKITAALDTTLSSFEQIQRLSGNAMDVRSRPHGGRWQTPATPWTKWRITTAGPPRRRSG